MPSDEPQVIREKMWVERPTGTHLSQVGIPGGLSTLARDDETSELETHATLFPITDEDDDGEAAAGDVYITNYYVANDASPSRELTDEERELLEKRVVLAALMAAGAWPAYQDPVERPGAAIDPQAVECGAHASPASRPQGGG